MWPNVKPTDVMISNVMLSSNVMISNVILPTDVMIIITSYNL